MKAWIYDNLPGDPTAAHNSNTPVSASALAAIGVHYSHHPTIDTVNTFAASRNYKNRDTVTISPEAMGAVFEDKLKMFFEEHLHEDEEIRYIEDGAGYFDVRGESEEWVRIWLEKGDLIVLPAGIWHRFTVDEGKYTKAVRLFKDEPKWTPLNRAPELEENPYRKGYKEALKTKSFDI